LRRPLLAATFAAALVVVPTSAATTPTISKTIDGIAGTNGWYRGSTHGDNVVLRWSVSADTTSTNCLPAITIPGPTTGHTETCWASNSDGTVIAKATIRIDAAPPTGVSLHIARPPDHKGWYNHPVGVAWSGSDATSGIASCTGVIYSGPEGAGVVVRGGCTDKAGNATSSSVAINYDATPPALSGISAGSTPGANVIRWKSSEPTARIVLRRQARANRRRVVLFEGRDSSFVDKRVEAGLEYVYTLRAVDQAGNRSDVATVVGLPKVLTLRRLPYVPRAAPKPVLLWQRVGNARYYNVQLFRGTKRVLAAWPGTHQLGVPKAWKWHGHRYRLAPGLYRWYVWAGFGQRSLAQYRVVGSARFIVPRHADR
jgi:hypothetical protein